MAAGFRSPLSPLGLSAGSTSAVGFKGLFAFWSGGAAVAPTSSGPGFKSLLAFWAGGAARGVGGTPVEENAGYWGANPYRRKKKLEQPVPPIVPGELYETVTDKVAPKITKTRRQEERVLRSFAELEQIQAALHKQIQDDDDDIATLLLLL